jgi:hypothetical protein
VPNQEATSFEKNENICSNRGKSGNDWDRTRKSRSNRKIIEVDTVDEEKRIQSSKTTDEVRDEPMRTFSLLLPSPTKFYNSLQIITLQSAVLSQNKML